MVISSLCIRFVALFVIFCACTSFLHAASASRPKSRPRVPIAAAASGNDTESTAGSDECPESDGFFPHPQQCDKYVECRDGSIYAEKLCPDGLVFNSLSAPQEKCDLPFNIDCSQRTKLQEPKPTDHCPRLNGYFSHEEPNVCNKFYYCVDGKFNLITCPDGLVYNERTGICSWPDEAKKKGCTSQDLFKFTCPKVDVNFAAQHPRYADPEDCQFFYVCINGEVPRRSGCKLGQVFNDKSGSCDSPKNVADCVDWYKGVLTDEELAAIEQESKPKPKPKPTKSQSHHRGSAGRRREKIDSHVEVPVITSSEESAISSEA